MKEATAHGIENVQAAPLGTDPETPCRVFGESGHPFRGEALRVRRIGNIPLEMAGGPI
jgi:hypothetical protein